MLLSSAPCLSLNLKNELTSVGIYLIKCVFAFLLKQFACSQDLKGTCSGIALVSAQVHLLAWWISGIRTQLLCGNQGDNCCQATTGLDQCAYTVKKLHSVHASVLALHSEKGIPITSSEKIIHKHLLHTARTLRTYRRALQQNSPCCRNGLLLGLFCHYRQKHMRCYSFSTLNTTASSRSALLHWYLESCECERTCRLYR